MEVTGCKMEWHPYNIYAAHAGGAAFLMDKREAKVASYLVNINFP